MFEDMDADLGPADDDKKNKHLKNTFKRALKRNRKSQPKGKGRAKRKAGKAGKGQKKKKDKRASDDEEWRASGGSSDGNDRDSSDSDEDSGNGESESANAHVPFTFDKWIDTLRIDGSLQYDARRNRWQDAVVTKLNFCFDVVYDQSAKESDETKETEADIDMSEEKRQVDNGSDNEEKPAASQSMENIEWSPVITVEDSSNKLKKLGGDGDNQEDSGATTVDWLSSLKPNDLVQYDSEDCGWRTGKIVTRWMTLTVRSWSRRGAEDMDSFSTIDEKSRLMMKAKLKPSGDLQLEATPAPKVAKPTKAKKVSSAKGKKKKRSQFEDSEESGVTDEQSESDDYDIGDSRGQSLSPSDGNNKIEHVLYCMEIPTNVKCWTQTFDHMLPQKANKDRTMQIDNENENENDSDKENGTSEHASTEVNMEKSKNKTATQPNTAQTDIRFQEKYLVKILNKSYHHCEWHTEDDLISTYDCESKIKNFKTKCETNGEFIRKQKRIGQYINHEKWDRVHFFNHSYLEIDRIIDQCEVDEDISIIDGMMSNRKQISYIPNPSNEIMYFVKWKGIPYDCSTWETGSFLKSEKFAQFSVGNNGRHQLDARDCDAGEFEIKLFRNRQKLPKRASINTSLKKQGINSSLRSRPKEMKDVTLETAFKNNNKLRYYQVDGVNWLVHNWKSRIPCILADEMGLGKTVQTVTFINTVLSGENSRGPILVCAPLSTLGHWQREFRAWSNLNVIVYHGSQDAREVCQSQEFGWQDYDFMSRNRYQEQLKNDKKYMRQLEKYNWKFNVLITTKEVVNSDEATLGRGHIPWQAIIVDEAHSLKSQRALFYRTLRGYQSSFTHTLLLTGTPIQNNMEELYSLLHFMDPKKFTQENEEAFLKKYGATEVPPAKAVKKKEEDDTETDKDADKGEDNDKSKTGDDADVPTTPTKGSKDGKDLQVVPKTEDSGLAKNRAQLKRLLEPRLLQRLKYLVEKSLMKREEKIIWVELTKFQKTWYRACYERSYETLARLGSHKASLMNVSMQLRKCCNHPFLMKDVENTISPPGTSEIDQNENLVKACGKLTLLDKLFPKLKAEGHRVLIFSQMSYMLDILEDYLNWRGHLYERLDGSVTGIERQEAIDRYTNDDSIFAFLLTTRAGGVGINLMAADTVIIYDSDWNPMNDVQAIARAHRIGQKKQVSVFRLVTRNCYEEEMFRRADQKMALNKVVMGDMKDLSKKDINYILKTGAISMFLNESETDKDIENFANASIDDILSSRCEKITHDDITSDGKLADPDAGMFSQAVFAAKKEDAEIDMEDENFWELVGVAKNAPKKDIFDSYLPRHKRRTRGRVKDGYYKKMDSKQRYNDNDGDFSDFEVDSDDMRSRSGLNTDDEMEEQNAGEPLLILIFKYIWGQWDNVYRGMTKEEKDVIFNPDNWKEIAGTASAGGNGSGSDSEDKQRDARFMEQEEYEKDLLFVQQRAEAIRAKEAKRIAALEEKKQEESKESAETKAGDTSMSEKKDSGDDNDEDAKKGEEDSLNDDFGDELDALTEYRSGILKRTAVETVANMLQVMVPAKRVAIMKKLEPMMYDWDFRNDLIKTAGLQFVRLKANNPIKSNTGDSNGGDKDKDSESNDREALCKCGCQRPVAPPAAKGRTIFRTFDTCCQACAKTFETRKRKMQQRNEQENSTNDKENSIKMDDVMHDITCERRYSVKKIEQVYNDTREKFLRRKANKAWKQYLRDRKANKNKDKDKDKADEPKRTADDEYNDLLAAKHSIVIPDDAFIGELQNCDSETLLLGMRDNLIFFGKFRQILKSQEFGDVVEFADKLRKMFEFKHIVQSQAYKASPKTIDFTKLKLTKACPDWWDHTMDQLLINTTIDCGLGGVSQEYAIANGFTLSFKGVKPQKGANKKPKGKKDSNANSNESSPVSKLANGVKNVDLVGASSSASSSASGASDATSDTATVVVPGEAAAAEPKLLLRSRKWLTGVKQLQRLTTVDSTFRKLSKGHLRLVKNVMNKLRKDKRDERTKKKSLVSGPTKMKQLATMGEGSVLDAIDKLNKLHEEMQSRKHKRKGAMSKIGGKSGSNTDMEASGANSREGSQRKREKEKEKEKERSRDKDRSDRHKSSHSRHKHRDREHRERERERRDKEHRERKNRHKEQKQKRKQTSIADMFGGKAQKPIDMTNDNSDEISIISVTTNGDGTDANGTVVANGASASAATDASKNATANGAASKPAKKKKKEVELKYDESGKLLFPIQVNRALQVDALGEIEYRHPKYHSLQRIWPIGYTSSCQFKSVFNPLSKQKTTYVTVIEKGLNGPQFTITMKADSSEDAGYLDFCKTFKISEKSASNAWGRLLQQIDDKEKEMKNGGDGDAPAGAAANGTASASGSPKSDKKKCSGPTRIGMNCGTIERLIEGLPNADKCKNYTFKHLKQSNGRHSGSRSKSKHRGSKHKRSSHHSGSGSKHKRHGKKHRGRDKDRESKDGKDKKRRSSKSKSMSKSKSRSHKKESKRGPRSNDGNKADSSNKDGASANGKVNSPVKRIVDEKESSVEIVSDNLNGNVNHLMNGNAVEDDDIQIIGQNYIDVNGHANVNIECKQSDAISNNAMTRMIGKKRKNMDDVNSVDNGSSHNETGFVNVGNGIDGNMTEQPAKKRKVMNNSSDSGRKKQTTLSTFFGQSPNE